MNPDGFFLVGKVHKTFGTSGELLLILESDHLLKLKKKEPVFILLQGKPVPFFIEEIRPKAKNQALAKFMDTEALQESISLLNAEIFLPNSMKPKTRKSALLDYDLAGFRVIDEAFGELGIVEGIIELPMQELLEINYNGKHILVPIVEGIILEIDTRSKTISTEIPEGLLEL